MPRFPIICIQIFLLVSVSSAEWGQTARDYIRLPLYQNAKLCSDGNGGCWAAADPVGLCHVDRDGNLTWGDEPYGLAPGTSYDPKLVLADNGDVILALDIVYEPNGPQTVYLQRINLDQEQVWGEGGIPIDTSRRQSTLGAYAGPIEDTYLIHWARRSEYGNYNCRRSKCCILNYVMLFFI